MTVKQWNIGDVLTAADMNAWTVPTAVVKSADTARNSVTAMADDPDLVLPVAASTTYHVHGIIFYDGPTAGASDLKYTWSIPAGASGDWFGPHQNLSAQFAGAFAGSNPGDGLWTGTGTANTNGVGTIMILGVTGILIVAGTAGNLTFRWAQNTSNATNTHVKAQSYLTAQRIA